MQTALPESTMTMPPPAPPKPDPNELMTLGEVAETFSVHVETVRRWVRKGIVPVVLVGPFKQKRIRRCIAASFFVNVDGAAN